MARRGKTPSYLRLKIDSRDFGSRSVAVPFILLRVLLLGRAADDASDASGRVSVPMVKISRWLTACGRAPATRGIRVGTCLPSWTYRPIWWARRLYPGLKGRRRDRRRAFQPGNGPRRRWRRRLRHRVRRRLVHRLAVGRRLRGRSELCVGRLIDGGSRCVVPPSLPGDMAVASQLVLAARLSVLLVYKIDTGIQQ